MLQDELKVLKNLVNDLTLAEPERDKFTVIDSSKIVQAISTACEQVKDAWLGAFFSESPDHSLQRYFYFHLEGISNLADTLFRSDQSHYSLRMDQALCTAVNDQLLALIKHLKENHGRFFNTELYSPISWWRKILKQNTHPADVLVNKLRSAGLPVEQSSTIISYLQEIRDADQPGCYSFHALNYYEGLIKTLTAVMDEKGINESSLNRHLTELNFNHLPYVDYRYDFIGHQLHSMETTAEKIRLLLNERNKLKLISFNGNTICHTRFPSITTMLDKWLCEQIIYVEEQHRLELDNGKSIEPVKLFLNLSVAQIGCLLRVLYEADCFGNTPLTDIFKFVTQHFSSKKQAAMSVGGLSKEYYGGNQVSAGKMIVLLQRLIAILKRIFFPLLVVASVISGV